MPKHKIEVIDGSNRITLCFKVDCNRTLACVELDFSSRDIGTVSAAIARTMAELSRPSLLTGMARGIIQHLEERGKAGGD